MRSRRRFIQTILGVAAGTLIEKHPLARAATSTRSKLPEGVTQENGHFIYASSFSDALRADPPPSLNFFASLITIRGLEAPWSVQELHRALGWTSARHVAMKPRLANDGLTAEPIHFKKVSGTVPRTLVISAEDGQRPFPPEAEETELQRSTVYPIADYRGYIGVPVMPNGGGIYIHFENGALISFDPREPQNHVERALIRMFGHA